MAQTCPTYVAGSQAEQSQEETADTSDLGENFLITKHSELASYLFAGFLGWQSFALDTVNGHWKK